MPDWITPEFWIGAVGGSFVGSSVTLYTYHHRHRYEKRNRDRDKKLQAYTTLVTVVDTLVENKMLFAEFDPLWPKLESGASLTDEEEKIVQRTKRLADELPDLLQLVKDATPALLFFGGRSPVKALGKMIDALDAVKICCANGQLEQLPQCEAEYRRAAVDFLYAARKELGVY